MTTQKIRLYGDAAVATPPASSSAGAKIRLYDYTPKQSAALELAKTHPANPYYTGSNPITPDFPVSNPITDALKPHNLIAAAQTVLPNASQAVKDIINDPFSIKRDAYTNFFPDVWKAIKDPIKEEAANIKALFSPSIKDQNPIGSERIGADLKVISGAGKVLFSPITALFAGANDIPILGTVSKAVSVPFTAAGESAAKGSDYLVDKLPISKEAKAQIKPGLADISALTAQILLGKTGWDSKIIEATKAKLTEKYGATDAQTIIDKATEVAAEKKAREFPKENPIPQQVQSDVQKAGFVTKPVPGVPGFETKPVPGTVKISIPEELKPLVAEAKAYKIDLGRKVNPDTVSAKVDSLLTDLENKPKATLKKLGFEVSGDPTSPNFIDETSAYVRSRLQTIKDGAIKINKALNTNPFDNTNPTPKATEVKVDTTKVVPAKAEPIKTEPLAKISQKNVESSSSPTPRIPGVSKASIDINRKLAAQGFDELPAKELSKYDPITKKAEIQKAADLISRDHQKAKDMAAGRIPTIGAHEQVLFNAVKNKAIAEGDAATLRDLATSPVATERAVAAQTLGASGFDNGIAEGDPVKAMADVIKAREEKATRTQGTKDIQKVKSTGAKEIKTEINKTHTKESWSSFVEGLKC